MDVKFIITISLYIKSLCYKSKMNTMLNVNYIPIKEKKKRQEAGHINVFPSSVAPGLFLKALNPLSFPATTSPPEWAREASEEGWRSETEIQKVLETGHYSIHSSCS